MSLGDRVRLPKEGKAEVTMRNVVPILGVVGLMVLSAGCAWFGEARAVGKSPEMLLVTTARHLGTTVSLSRIALERSSNEDVKRFAQQAMSAHEQMIQDVRGFADRRKTPILPTPDTVDQTVAAHLRELSGAELDREYIKEMIAQHAEMTAKFQVEAQQGNDPELRQWAERQIPVYRNHLEMAEHIQQSLVARR
jgi:predicted outer membrane protein